MQSELARLEMERRKRRERPAPPKPKPSKKSISPVVQQTIDEINRELKPILEIELGNLENVALSFALHADTRQTEAMNEDLIQFESGLRNVNDLLEQDRKLIVDTYQKTGSALDAQTILSSTFSINATKDNVVQNLLLLEGVAEASIDKIRFDNQQSRRTLELLKRIQKFGDEHFETYQPRTVEIKMDVAGDVALARRLAGLSNSTRIQERSTFIPVDEPTQRRTLTLKEAVKIVDGMKDVDILTLKEILKAKGFSREIVREALLKARERRRPSPLTPTVGPSSVDLSMLSMRDLSGIAKKYGLKDYKRKNKHRLTVYLQNNLTSDILENEVRDKLYNYTYREVPIIQIPK